jgi:hypothetical protein
LLPKPSESFRRLQNASGTLLGFLPFPSKSFNFLPGFGTFQWLAGSCSEKIPPREEASPLPIAAPELEEGDSS